MATTTSASSGSTGTSKATSGGIVKGFLILAVVLIVGQWAWNREHGSNAPAQPTAAQGYAPSSGNNQVARPVESEIQVSPAEPLFKKWDLVVTPEWGQKIYLAGNHLSIWNSPNVEGTTDVHPLIQNRPGDSGLAFNGATWIRLRTKSGTAQVAICSHPVGTRARECSY